MLLIEVLDLIGSVATAVITVLYFYRVWTKGTSFGWALVMAGAFLAASVLSALDGDSPWSSGGQFVVGAMYVFSARHIAVNGPSTPLRQDVREFLTERREDRQAKKEQRRLEKLRDEAFEKFRIDK